MAGNVLGITFSLLLLASIIQGGMNLELFLNQTLEAEVGENVTMPCFMEKATDPKIISIKWRKNGGTNLAVYNPLHGNHYFWPNVTIQVKRDYANILVGSYLHLPWVNKWDSGNYTCEVATFYSGSFTNETKLTVNDKIEVLCDSAKVVEVDVGDNATIRCTVNSIAKYTWTKNNETVSENPFLELWQVTEAQAGVYELTVHAGDKDLNKDFIISVLTATTTLRTDPTESSRGPTDPPTSSTAVSLATALSKDINCCTEASSSTITVPATGHVTPSTTLASVWVSSSPNTQTISNQLLHSTMLNKDLAEIRSTKTLTSDDTKDDSLTAESKIQSTEHPGTTSTGSATTDEMLEQDSKRSHVLSVFLILLLLLLILVVVILYSRQLMKNRMDLPPPFKPPPPPVKYIAAGQSETQLFPTARCNSVSETARQIII